MKELDKDEFERLFHQYRALDDPQGKDAVAEALWAMGEQYVHKYCFNNYPSLCNDDDVHDIAADALKNFFIGEEPIASPYAYFLGAVKKACWAKIRRRKDRRKRKEEYAEVYNHLHEFKLTPGNMNDKKSPAVQGKLNDLLELCQEAVESAIGAMKTQDIGAAKKKFRSIPIQTLLRSCVSLYHSGEMAWRDWVEVCLYGTKSEEGRTLSENEFTYFYKTRFQPKLEEKFRKRFPDGPPLEWFI